MIGATSAKKSVSLFGSTWGVVNDKKQSAADSEFSLSLSGFANP